MTDRLSGFEVQLRSHSLHDRMSHQEAVAIVCLRIAWQIFTRVGRMGLAADQSLICDE